MLGLTVPDSHPKSSAHLAYAKFSIFVELNLISNDRLMMSSSALEKPTETCTVFLSKNLPKYGPGGTKPAKNWTNSRFADAK